QSQNDDFGWDSESHGKYTRADSSGNDQFLSVLLHQTVCITLTEPGRHDQPAGNGQVHLSAVRVSGESQADSFRHFGKQIGVMHEHEYRPGVIDLRHGLQQAVPARPQTASPASQKDFPRYMIGTLSFSSTRTPRDSRAWRTRGPSDPGMASPHEDRTSLRP